MIALKLTDRRHQYFCKLKLLRACRALKRPAPAFKLELEGQHVPFFLQRQAD